MPEGHTLRRLAGALTDTFAGRRVGVSSPNGRFAADAEQIDGTVLLGADSAGKHLFAEFEHDRFVHVHLGLIGRFDITTAADDVPPPVGEVRLRLTARDARDTSYADLRGAIIVDLVGPARRAGGAGPARPRPAPPGRRPRRGVAPGLQEQSHDR